MCGLGKIVILGNSWKFNENRRGGKILRVESHREDAFISCEGLVSLWLNNMLFFLGVVKLLFYPLYSGSKEKISYKTWE